MRYPKGAEEWIVLVVVIGLLAMILFFLVGCNVQKKEAYTVDYIKGCSIKVKVATAESAGKMVEQVNFKDCEVSHSEEIEQGPPKQPRKD